SEAGLSSRSASTTPIAIDPDDDKDDTLLSPSNQSSAGLSCDPSVSTVA
ncbi:TPA_asm: hypothetical protein, partial [ssRNA phage Gerhypos.1_46]